MNGSRRIKKVIAVLTALALSAGMLLLLAGCGGDGGGATHAPDNTGPLPTGSGTDATPMVKEGNVALGCPVTFLNVELPQGGELTDGDRETGFHGTINYRKSMSTQITVDLGGIVKVRRVDIYPARQDGYFRAAFPREITVLLSADGRNYTEACRYVNIDAPDCVPVLEFDAADARFVTLKIESRSIGEDGFGEFELAEIEVVSVYGEYAYPD